MQTYMSPLKKTYEGKFVKLFYFYYNFKVYNI